jgi:hypothetical protein
MHHIVIQNTKQFKPDFAVGDVELDSTQLWLLKNDYYDYSKMTTVKNDYGNNDYDNIDYCQLWLLLKMTTYLHEN